MTMVAIEEMKMPKRCAECKLCIRHKTNDYGSYGQCMAANCETVSTLNWSLPPSCPLVEIVTCNDCKYCVMTEVGCYCDRHVHRLDTHFDKYCADGERRE